MTQNASAEGGKKIPLPDRDRLDASSIKIHKKRAEQWERGAHTVQYWTTEEEVENKRQERERAQRQKQRILIIYEEVWREGWKKNTHSDSETSVHTHIDNYMAYSVHKKIILIVGYQ